MAKQNILTGSIHTGRPKDEDPHIKQFTKNKKEIIEYIVNVDLAQLGIDDNTFKELQALFQLFDLDRDGVLTLIEFEMVLRTLGRAYDKESAIKIVEQISVDKTNHSVSFNEFLTFNGNVKTTTNPTDLLLECFEMFDLEKTGKIQETVFKRILTRKGGKQVKELDDMLDAYKKIHCKSSPETPIGQEYIDYRAFINMLEN